MIASIILIFFRMDSDVVEEDPLDSIIHDAELKLSDISEKMKIVHEELCQLSILKNQYTQHIHYLKLSMQTMPHYTVHTVVRKKRRESFSDDEYEPTQKSSRCLEQSGQN